MHTDSPLATGPPTLRGPAPPFARRPTARPDDRPLSARPDDRQLRGRPEDRRPPARPDDQPPSAGPDDRRPPAGGLDLGVRLDQLGAVAGPLTLVSALAYYIGSVRQEALVRYFGLDTSLLQLSSRDYVVRSTDALVRFVAGLCVGALLLVAAHLLIGAVLAPRPTLLKAWSLVVAAVGVAAIVAGGWRLTHPVPLEGLYLLGPACLGTGALLLGFGARRLTSSPAPNGTSRWVTRVGSLAIVALVLVGMFWGANDYARAQGHGRAVQLAGSLAGLPVATVYSEAPLGLGTAGVVETSVGTGEHPQYRYDGLRLLMRSEDAFFLIPEEWTPNDGSVVMLPDREGIRLEFSPRRSS